VSLRTFNRNFLARSGTADASVYLVSPEVAAASAIAGVFTDPTTLGKAPEVSLPEKFTVNDNLIELPASPEEATSITVERGPNIKPIPKGEAPAEDLSCKLILKVGDNITTDHIMPAGAKILPYRSNVPKLSEYCFTVCDKDFPERAKREGGGVILGGANYGQGSSREHAALVPLYLGVKAVIAKSFARIHMANLVNFGIAPITLANEADYDKIAEGDEIMIEGFAEAIKSADSAYLTVKKTGERIPLVLNFSARQREILLAGGTLNYTKNQGK
jgi:aconitate hydratase